jgi:dipeptidyl aminopeptidase/acylaminoacyl peptidase
MKRTLSAVLYALVLSLIVAHAQVGSSTPGGTLSETFKSPWASDDIVMAEQASDFEISPNGKWVVWVRSTPDKESDRLVSNLVLSSLTGTKEIQLTRGNDGASSPKWSPNGELISFTTSRKSPDISKEAASEQLWLINPFGGEAWRVSNFARAVTDYYWSDTDTIIFSAKETASYYENTIKKADKSVVIEDETHEPPVRLFKFSIKSGAVQRLTDNRDRISDFAVSPNGKWAVTVNDQALTYEYDNRIKPLVFLYDLSTGSRQQILKEPNFNLRDTKWSPSGEGFYFSNSFKSDPTYLWGVLGEMYYFDLASRAVSKVDLDWERGLTGSFVTTKDGFICLLANGARNKPARFVREGNKWNRTFLSGDHAENIFGLLLGKDGTTLLYNHSTASKPTQWYKAWLVGERIEGATQLTKLNKDFAGKAIAKTELVKWKGALDEEVEGILYYPADYRPGQKYPLVVMIHGGPTLVDYDAWKETWTYPHNLYAQRGAFVFAPNYHGSSNYGIKWAESIGGGKYYDLEVPDIEKGVDYLIGRGLVDPERMGLLGWSNGSLLTIELTTRTTRYKAAGAGAGTVDWASDWANAYFGASFDNYYFGKSPLEDPKRYMEKSPFYRLDRVRTPTIIFFGEDDRTVAPSQGWMHYRALQQIGKTDVKFVMFPDSGHSLRRLSFQKRKLEEELAWFDKYLFGTAKPVNEALKPDSPLQAALKAKSIKRAAGRLGVIRSNRLIPEAVNYKGIDVGRFEVTRAQFAEFDLRYKFAQGTRDYPVNGITFEQARSYARWLSDLTGEKYRLPTEEEASRLYNKGSSGENTLDYWAGYSVNPEDEEKLRSVVEQLTGTAPLLRPVGSFRGDGTDEPVFDLGGNVSEWVEDGKQGAVMGGNAAAPADSRIQKQQSKPEYVGFRIVREGAAVVGH